MPISAIDAVGLALQHTKEQLLRPFRMAQWVKLAFVGFLAGELSSWGCGGGNFQPPTRPRAGQPFPFPHANLLMYASLIALLIVLAMILWIVFLYVSSVMRFILFDSIIAKRCEIRRYWSQRNQAGVRYFVWQLLFMLAMTVGMTVLIGVPAAFALAAGWLKDPRHHFLPLILGGMFLFFVVAGFVPRTAVHRHE